MRPGPSRSYAALMDQAMIEKAEAEKLYPAYYPLRPSAASKCSRALAMELAEFQGLRPRTFEERKPNITRLLDFGSAVEYHAIRHIERIKGLHVKFKQQVVDIFTLDSGKVIEGSTDLAIFGPEGKCLADIKSVGDRFYNGFETKWKGMTAKYDQLQSIERIDDNGFYVTDPVQFLKDVGVDDSIYSNILQVNLYANSDFMKARGIDHGSIIRYLKNTSECMEIRFKPNQELFDMVKAKFNDVEAAVKSGNPASVPNDCMLGTMACAFNHHCKEHCWPTKDTLKEWFNTWPKRDYPQPIGELYNGSTLGPMFDQYLQLENSTSEKETLSQLILKEMVKAESRKVKLPNGSMFEIVAYKSPYPHFELKRVHK